ncbi:hypothetical protein TVAG_252650 [Trichomonas vaginalis G3]|uniref:Uncharacterized protein n=1 Tax=Trichomonas vaginalis (strain ATCC PRA-98 / G3) TaxID=412133 RepID=A2DW07_TRIV3|nr:hypothetical protein TVAGG3_0845300 [Trichomonas vaginalis G3]EAY15452.1 hypothetical protein TVAG_252650 [Trichomonas vaginalis G3]KAI5499563.1 hypothetical protein TVAGG3_0845300 [Trichomonas vaginalis G3]|eukprot:XP_001327675.1 hypothetical protein [Trichomonas vaginalis G3]
MNHSSNPNDTADGSNGANSTNISTSTGKDFLFRSNKKLSDIIQTLPKDSYEIHGEDTVLIKNQSNEINKFFIVDKLNQDLIVECPYSFENIYKEADISLLPFLQDSYCISSEGITYLIFKNSDSMKEFCMNFNTQKFVKESISQSENETIRLADFLSLKELDDYILLDSYKEYFVCIPFAQNEDDAHHPYPCYIRLLLKLSIHLV